ncbi:uncharacterized protein M6B38_284625 [Iris pallida]|uniref:Uncharacterized protein n=1 Tax=Iris pallida TaxID=29817 RepID=A0AAX6I1V5_IRIPA|nr:uncharacterized protein M6B38_284625 [Iris pallida]
MPMSPHRHHHHHQHQLTNLQEMEPHAATSLPPMNALEILRETVRLLRSSPLPFLSALLLLLCPVSAALLSVEPLLLRHHVLRLSRRLLLLLARSGLPVRHLLLHQLSHHLSGALLSSLLCLPLLLSLLLPARSLVSFSVASLLYSRSSAPFLPPPLPLPPPPRLPPPPPHLRPLLPPPPLPPPPLPRRPRLRLQLLLPPPRLPSRPHHLPGPPRPPRLLRHLRPPHDHLQPRRRHLRPRGRLLRPPRPPLLRPPHRGPDPGRPPHLPRLHHRPRLRRGPLRAQGQDPELRRRLQQDMGGPPPRAHVLLRRPHRLHDERRVLFHVPLLRSRRRGRGDGQWWRRRLRRCRAAFFGGRSGDGAHLRIDDEERKEAFCLPLRRLRGA